MRLQTQAKYLEQNRAILSNWTVEEKFNIYFSMFFNCCCKILISSKDTGRHLQGFQNSSVGWVRGGEPENLQEEGRGYFLQSEANLRRNYFGDSNFSQS